MRRGGGGREPAARESEPLRRPTGNEQAMRSGTQLTQAMSLCLCAWFTRSRNTAEVPGRTRMT
jgi:hypothetical protein